LTFLAVAWANSFVNPLRAITAALQRNREGHLETKVPSRGAREFRALSASLNAMVENLAHQKQAVSEAVAQKVAVLRTLLPPAVADAVDEGDRTLVETVPHTTVAVIVVELTTVTEEKETPDPEADRLSDERKFVPRMVAETESPAEMVGWLKEVTVGSAGVTVTAPVKVPEVPLPPPRVMVRLRAPRLALLDTEHSIRSWVEERTVVEWTVTPVPETETEVPVS